MPALSQILSAAARHGRESEPDHEVGDLQDALRACWKQPFPDQKERVIADPHVQNVLEWHEDNAWTDEDDDCEAS